MQSKKGITIAGLVLLAILFLTSCNGENTNATEQKSDTAKSKTDSLAKTGSDTIRDSKNTARMDADVQFVITKNESDENPSSVIEISSGGKTSPVSKISGYADLIYKNDFKSKEIPENAITACGAWWAGAGDYFYVVSSANKLLIYQGWQDEGQTDQGYHWKKMKEIER